MKIGMISDLHVDTNQSILQKNETFSSLLADIIKEKDIELLLLAGDNSSDAYLSHRVTREIKQKSGIDVLFVPGNHDLWSRTNGVTDTNELYAYFKAQEENIIGKPYLISNQWAVVGTGGWYDYGYGDSTKYTLEEFEKKHYRFASWNDKHHINWGKSDQDVSKEMLIQLEKDLQSVGDRQIILMTHVATHSEFVVPLPNKVYDYFNAFLGSSSYEGLYERYPIRYSLIGHVHIRKLVKEGHTTLVTACLGNKKHWISKNAREEIERTLVIINV